MKDHNFAKLVRSIQDDPEMLELRELLVFPYNGKYVVIAGNMRLQAAIELEFDTIPCKVIPESTSVDKLRAILAKDNISFGEWDFDELYNSWDISELEDWGLSIAFPTTEAEEEPEQPIIESTVIKLEYTKEDYLKVKEQLALIANTPEQAVWKLLGNE